jgi:membrane-associated protease RseP (regulator of RpoE activity)
MAIHKVSKVLIGAVLALGLAGAAPSALAAWGNPGDTHGSAYLGVMVDSVSPETAASLHLKNGGALIANVDQDGPACHAGLQTGDIVVTFNGKPVSSSDQFASLIHASAPGSTATMTVIRNGQSKDMKVTLGDWGQMAGMAPKAPLSPPGAMPFIKPIPPMPPRMYPDIDIPAGTTISSRQGIVVEPLSPQLCDFFGVPQNRGVLVRSVDKGSPGAAAGLKAGDVIVKVNDENIHDVADWRRALRSQNGKVALGIVRDKKEQVLQVNLPANTSEWKSRDWDGFEVDTATLAMLSPDQMAEIRREAEEAASSWTPEMQKQMESLKLQSEEIRRQAESAAKTMTPEMQKQAAEWSKQSEEWSKQSAEMREQMQQMSKDLAKMTPEMAKAAEEWAETTKPNVKQIEEMTREFQKQWQTMQPQFQKQMEQLQKQIDEEMREWQKTFKEDEFKLEF